MAVVLPKDYRGKFIYDAAGTGTTPAALLYPCEGYSNETPFTASAVSINIKGLPDPNSYPSTASVSLAVTQQQFLDTKVAELETLATRIDTRVEANGRDTRTLRDFLAVVVSKAEEDLDTTEKEYQRVMLKAGERIPPFFTDFRKKYENLHVELLAPIPGESARIGTSPHLVLVQQTLQRRPHNTNSGASGNQSGSSPVIANGTKALIEDNASAYRIAKLQGSQPKFHATFKSIPDKATLYYRPEFEPNFDTYSKTTNIDGADFPLGWYVFKFHKDDCQDEPVKTINANEDTTPEIFVEFQKCKRK